MDNIGIISTAVIICIVSAGALGAVLIRMEIKKHIKGISAIRVVKIFKKQAGKARAELKSLKKIRSVMGARKVRREMLEGTALMRNRIAACEGKKITTDVMLEELIADSDVLRYPYSRMLSLVRTEEHRKAVNEFAAIVNEKDAAEYAEMIIRLDDMDPADVYDSVISFQKNMKEERITEIKKRDEAVSDILYLPVVLNLLIIFFNFLYVTYFTQQKDFLEFFT